MTLPDWVVAPLLVAVVTAVIGGLGLALGVPWLFPSLGPTAFLQVHKPGQDTSRPYHVFVGHMIGAAVGALVVVLTGAGQAAPVLSSGVLEGPRVVAAVLAMGLTLMAQMLLKASHPPAAATTLLIALGGFSVTAREMTVLVAGVVVLTALGEAARRLRLRGGGAGA